MNRIETISHILTVRIHSRMLVTLPSRFSSALLKVLSNHASKINIVFVSHFNHPTEITQQVRDAVYNLKKTGISLLNQSVLLAQINNTVDCLRDLFLNLYEVGIIPFYLHHPDWTPGTFHFRISIESGRNLVSKLRGLLPGPALPQYILDSPDGHGKISLMDYSVRKTEAFSELDSNLNSKQIQGAVYEITGSTTRKEQESTYQYLDLFFQ